MAELSQRFPGAAGSALMLPRLVRWFAPQLQQALVAGAALAARQRLS